LARLLGRLPELFRERYLNTHELYLKALADVVAHFYLGWNKDFPNYAQLVAFLKNGNVPLKLNDEPDQEQPQFRNLRNSWYHELALRHPEDFDIRVKFAGWKITQAYYAIFSSIGALVRCLRPIGSLSHDATLNVYSNEILASRRFHNSVLPPASTYMNQQGMITNIEMLEIWDYAKTQHVPTIRKCLASVGEGKSRISSVVHYLKDLREWATYEDAYLLFRMYGPTVKQNLDYSLQTLVSFYLTQSEVFLTKTFGRNAMETQFLSFNEQLRSNMGLEHTHLIARFDAYHQFLGEIRA
jgi:hypothetical protein